MYLFAGMTLQNKFLAAHLNAGPTSRRSETYHPIFRTRKARQSFFLPVPWQWLFEEVGMQDRYRQPEHAIRVVRAP